MKFLKRLMEKGELPNPYELKKEDVGEFIDLSFYCALKSDVGRLIFLRDGIIQMESIEQKKKRQTDELISNIYFGVRLDDLPEEVI